MLGCSRHEAAQAAFRTVVSAGAGLDLAHVAVTIAGRDYAASSRVMPSGTIVIELDVAPAGLAPRVITGDAYRAAVRTASARSGRASR